MTLLEPFDTPFGVPPFDRFGSVDFLPAIERALADARAEVDAIAEADAPPTFANTVEALERSGERLSRLSAIFFNLNAAETNETIQRDAQQISPLLSAYGNDVLLNAPLFARVKSVYEAEDRAALTPEQRTLLEKTYRGFVRNGANLGEAEQQRLREIDQELAGLSVTFGERLLKATNDYALVVSDEAELGGLPPDVRAAAARTARQRDLPEGHYAFTLQYPSYLPFMKYAQHRGHREALYRAFAARAYGGDHDNQEHVRRIAALRHARAQLLGFPTHAHFVLAERMAESPGRVRTFLDDLLGAALPAARTELDELTAFARERGGPETLQRWDFAYYAEQLKKARYEIDDEALKPYFPLQSTLEGMFAVAGKLYGLTFEPRTDLPVYHADVRTYEVRDGGRHLGVLYADFFPRPGKRSGAWMTAYRGQRRTDDTDQRPHISIVCNFNPPGDAGQPSLLTFQEVTTLFHEFGHALHGLLADGTYESLSGTSVYWDFVELPSQIMENWTYEPECLDLFARHYQTGEPLPATWVERLKASAQFLSGYQTVRQIGLARLDLAWHATDPSAVDDVAAHEDAATAETELLPDVTGTNTSCAFGHIFQGGYSAGYYSYKWAEVLDADAYELFKERGIFDPATASAFREHVLAAGGSEHPAELYRRFRGRDPEPAALLRRAGLVGEEG